MIKKWWKDFGSYHEFYMKEIVYFKPGTYSISFDEQHERYVKATTKVVVRSSNPIDCHLYDLNGSPVAYDTNTNYCYLPISLSNRADNELYLLKVSGGNALIEVK